MECERGELSTSRPYTMIWSGISWLQGARTLDKIEKRRCFDYRGSRSVRSPASRLPCFLSLSRKSRLSGRLLLRALVEARQKFPLLLFLAFWPDQAKAQAIS